MNRNNIPAMICLWTLMCCSSSYANVKKIDKDASPLDVLLAATYVSDLNPTTDETNEASGITLAPKGQLVTSTEGMEFLFDYKIDLQRFKLTEESLLIEDSQKFDTYDLALLSRFHVGGAWHVDAEVEHLNKTLKFGEGISALRSDVLNADQFRENSGAINVVYGNDSSSRYVSLKVSSSKYSYEANNDYSSLFDLTQTGVEFNVAFRRSSATRLLLRVSGSEEDYVSALRQDNSIYQTLLGINWEPSGKTKLDALVGMYWRESNEQSSDDKSSGLSWSINYSLTPTEDWLIRLNSKRNSGTSISESTSNSVLQDIGLNVTYKPSDQWHFSAESYLERTEFEEGAEVTDLDAYRLGVSATFLLKDYNKVSLVIGKSKLTYDKNLIDYDQNEVHLKWQFYL